MLTSTPPQRNQSLQTRRHPNPKQNITSSPSDPVVHISTDPNDDGGCFTLTTEELKRRRPSRCRYVRVFYRSDDESLRPSYSRRRPHISIHIRSFVNRQHHNTSPLEAKWSLKLNSRSGGLLVDDHFRAKLIPRQSNSSSSSTSEDGGEAAPEATMQDVLAIGDVSVMENAQLPATGEVANQEAKWFGKAMNKRKLGEKEGFNFKNLGVMTYLGNMKAITQAEGGNEVKGDVVN